MGEVNLDAWWRSSPKESKIVTFMLMRECSAKETERCMKKKNEVKFIWF